MSFEIIMSQVISDAQYIVLYLICTVIADVKPSWKSGLIYCVIGIAFDRLSAFINAFTMILFALNIVAVLCQTIFAFGLKGKRMLIVTVENLIVVIAASMLCAVVTTALYGSQQVAEVLAADVTRPIYLNLTNIVVMLTFWLFLSSIVSMIRKENHQMPKWLPLARSIILLFGTIIVGMILLRDIRAYDAGAKLDRILLTFALAIALLLASFSSLMQEIQTLKLRERGETLEREKQINEAIIKDMRVFRHNIINILHGFRGVIASGDTTEQTYYYESLARELARLNNENVVALTQIRIPALQAILMEKLKTAADADLPMYLYAKNTPVLRGETEKQFCIIAGILLDNAIEAARESKAGNIRVEVSKTGENVSLTIMNTFPENLDVDAFLAGNSPSSKEGHMGIGLLNANEIVRKNSRMSFFQSQKGRYIESVIVASTR